MHTWKDHNHAIPVQSADEYSFYTKCIEGGHYQDPDRIAWVSFFEPEEYENSSIPSEMDWRAHGVISEVKDQVRILRGLVC